MADTQNVSQTAPAGALQRLPAKGLSRRTFLNSLGAVALAVGAIGAEPGGQDRTAQAAVLGPLKGRERRRQATQIRMDAAWANHGLPMQEHHDNGDEALYDHKIGSFSKGLPHNQLGEVDLSAYRQLHAALQSGQPEDFERIPMGCDDPQSPISKLVNPQAGLAFELEGADAQAFLLPPAPPLASARIAAEIVENYWMALLRDVPFHDYATHPLAAEAMADLNALTDFSGPRRRGVVTPQTLFREDLPGCLTGPYLSQFMLKGTPFGAESVERRMRTVLPGHDFMTTYTDWLDVQNGACRVPDLAYDPVLSYIRNGRDLGQWVHIDVLFQAYFNACLILLTPPDAGAPSGGGIGAPFNPGNPYNTSQTQYGFGTFGPPGYMTLLCEVASRALKAVWFQKWYVHRRLRPEAFAGLVHHRLHRASTYPVHADVLNSKAVDIVFRRFGTYLLPMAFPEGCPTHPAYGAGHATVAGACVTILKALFEERFVIPDPVVVSDDGSRLLPYQGATLRVGGELNKLAWNIAIGRNHAGVHWRSDATESLQLGEAVAISLLRDQRQLYNESFAGFTFTNFAGTRITV